MESVRNNDDFRLKIIEQINSARKEPQAYADKVRKYIQYFKGKVLKIPENIPIMTTEGSVAYEEAAFFLDNSDSLPPLKYCPGLTHAAHDALLDIQKKEDVDSLNEMNIDANLEKHGTVVGHFAQAVDFGSSLPELVVVNLLVDDGDKAKENRQNIMNPQYKLVGVSTGAHPVYHKCSVLMYARHFYPPNEVPGDLSDENYDSKEDKKKAEEAQKPNVIRRTSLSMVKASVEKKIEEVKLDEELDVPEGVLKIEKQEKVVTEGGVKKRVVKIIKHMENGDIETEIFKEKV